MKDAAMMIATICALEILRYTFGNAVAMAVAITAWIACMIFLWHAGKEKA